MQPTAQAVGKGETQTSPSGAKDSLFLPGGRRRRCHDRPAEMPHPSPPHSGHRPPRLSFRVKRGIYFHPPRLSFRVKRGICFHLPRLSFRVKRGICFHLPRLSFRVKRGICSLPAGRTNPPRLNRLLNNESVRIRAQLQRCRNRRKTWERLQAAAAGNGIISSVRAAAALPRSPAGPERLPRAKDRRPRWREPALLPECTSRNPESGAAFPRCVRAFAE